MARWILISAYFNASSLFGADQQTAAAGLCAVLLAGAWAARLKSVTAADVNGDGRVDLISANAGDTTRSFGV